MKKILLFIALLTTTFGWSQFEVISIDRDNDNFCENDFKTYVITVIHPGLDAPNMDVNILSSNQGFLDFTHNNPFALIDTVKFFVDISDEGLVAPGAVQIDTIQFSFEDFDANPLPVLDTMIIVTASGLVEPTFDFTGVSLCTNSQLIDFDNYASIPGGTYDIGGEIVESLFNPKTYYQETGNTSFTLSYDITTTEGCNGFIENPFDLNLPPSLIVTTTPSNCGAAVGDATANISPGTATGMMDVYWSTGLSENVSSTSMISNLSSGVYYANVTDGLGCKAVGTAQVGDVDIVVSDVISSPTCAGLNDGSIDLTISTAGNVTQTFWSNGVTTEDMTGHSGEYTVEIHTDNNCNAFGTYIIPASDIEFELNAGSPMAGDCSGSSNGGANVTVTGGTGALNVVWTGSGGFTQSGDNLASADPGMYTCTITDGNNCTVDWDVIVPSFNNIQVDVNTVTKSDCATPNGSVDATTYDWGGGAGTFTWRDESNTIVGTTVDLINVAAGDYSLEIENDAGCSNFMMVTVPVKRPYQPSICLLTVDQSLVYNEVVWEKDPNNIVDGYNIYRETGTFGVFEQVVSLPYAHESFYIDNAASPVDRSWRYFITSYDACSESYGSFIHKTIHIVQTANNGTDVDIAWDDYEGITYASIDVMRYDATNGWEAIANLPIGTNNYTDTPPVFTDLDYMISFNLASPCTSTKAQDHNASRSNTSSSTFIGGEPTDLSVIEKEEGTIKLFPNPTSENLNIFIENADDYDIIKIVNINGELVYEQLVSESLNRVSTANFAKGIYFVQIYSENGIVTEKIVKQ